tara:strand:- start:56 stop:568 length:513 start_codon:yes stop_codon:yes gene_type:complete
MKRFSLLLIFSFSFFFFSCEEEVIEGCTDQTACNYNPEATELILGACNYPLESILEITYSEDFVTGLVGEDVESNIHLQNSSCEMVSVKARKMTIDTQQSSSYFCFAGVCFDSDAIVSPNSLVLESFQMDDFFKGYFSASVAGLYEITYMFYLSDDPSVYIEKTITYEII